MKNSLVKTKTKTKKGGGGFWERQIEIEMKGSEGKFPSRFFTVFLQGPAH